MVRINGRYGSEVYPEIINTVRRSGARRDSRNGPTYDLEDVTIQLESPLNALPLGCGRNLNPRIAAAEALQLIGGFSAPEWLCRIAPQFEKFREDFTVNLTETAEYPRTELVPWFYGAYGNRITLHRQLDAVVRRLRADPVTRQAIITLWQPELDAEDGHLDYPCTVALGFRRDGKILDKLSMKVLMRSNDCWLGTPYDIFMFTQMQLTLCNVLNLQPGTYTHTAWSMHLYMTNVDESYRVTDNLITRPTHMEHVTGVGRAWSETPLADVQLRARQLALMPDQVGDPTDSERWYVDLLREFSLEK